MQFYLFSKKCPYIFQQKLLTCFMTYACSFCCYGCCPFQLLLQHCVNLFCHGLDLKDIFLYLTWVPRYIGIRVCISAACILLGKQTITNAFEPWLPGKKMLLQVMTELSLSADYSHGLDYSVNVNSVVPAAFLRGIWCRAAERTTAVGEVTVFITTYHGLRADWDPTCFVPSRNCYYSRTWGVK